jgi:hypothetical protein
MIASNHRVLGATRDPALELLQTVPELYFEVFLSIATRLCGFRKPRLRRLDRAIDIGLVFHEILAEHFDQTFRGCLESLFVRPAGSSKSSSWPGTAVGTEMPK